MVNTRLFAVSEQVLGRFAATCALGAGLLAGCGGGVIANTHVEDTEENREIVDFVERYRHAVENRDSIALLAMASERYLDDLGTPAGDDDVDYARLKQELPIFKQEVSAARYQISYRAVQQVQDHFLVDVLYTGWFRVETPTGPSWKRRLQPHRLVVAREDDTLKLMSGM